MFTGSKKELLDHIKRNGTLSVDEAVEYTELAKSTLREHFLQLERDDHIQREYIRSGPGRPSLQYQLTQKGHSLYPSYESEMIRELLEFLKEKGDEETIELFFKSFWKQRLHKARKLMDDASENDDQQRLEALMSMLEEEGFMPEFNFDEEGESLTVKACNCPFREVVKETQLPCKLEAMFYRKLFNEKAERTTHIASGDHACTYDILAKKSQI
jgi:predicted ArsR family transcriptional regulator